MNTKKETKAKAMASSHIFNIILLVATAFAQYTLATEFLVGDADGWRTNFSYQDWAKGKEFRVGDKLVFKYSQGEHTVLKVDGSGFEDCQAPASTEALSSGEDVITLNIPGKKWYICGVGKHCEDGKQKLVINVLAKDGYSTNNPSSHGSTTTTAPSFKLFGCLLPLFAAAFL